MIIGIDIGTSFSSVAMLKDGKAKEVKVGNESSYSVPSAVYALDGGELLIGEAAVARRMKDPARFKYNFKRDFGTDKPYLLGNFEIASDEIYTEYFKLFKKSVEELTGVGVSKAYITHPVGYSKKKKLLLEQSARFAGLNDVNLIDEPTAAALSYFSDHMPKKGETLLVYDLGGGTLDITLVKMTNNSFELMADPVGDQKFGGADFDRLLFEEIKSLIKKDHDIEKALQQDRFIAMLQEASISAKLDLSRTDVTHVNIPIGFDYAEYTISRERFNKLIEAKVRKSCKLIETIAQNAGLKSPAHIDKVLCVGGSTRIPFVTTCIEETIYKSVLKTADPELAVCLGAVLKEVINRPHESKASEGYSLKKENIVQDEKVISEREKAPAKAQESKNQTESNASEGYRYKKENIVQDEPVEIVNEEDIEKAQQLLTSGWNELGLENYKEAAKYFNLSAELGNAEAQNSLGLMYLKGAGVVENNAEAVAWFRKAAEQGNADGQYYLGVMYLNGLGVRQSDEEAERLLRLSAEQGDMDAHRRLYVMGIGDTSVWKNISTQEEANIYAEALVEKLEISDFLGNRHHMPVADWVSTFKDRFKGAKTYAKLSKKHSGGEFPIYIYDCTTLGVTGTNGVTATNKAIHFRDLGSSSTDPGEKVYWNAIHSFKEDTIKMKNKAYGIPCPLWVDADKSKHLKILHQMWNDFK